MLSASGRPGGSIARGGGTLRNVWIAPVLIAAALAVALMDGNSGLPAWLRLHGDLRSAEQRMQALRAEIAEAEREAEALRDDPVAIEAAIREDLGLARPGETVVRVRGPDVPSTRIP